MGKGIFRRIRKDDVGAQRHFRALLLPAVQHLLHAVHDIQFQPVPTDKVAHHIVFGCKGADDAGGVGTEFREQPQVVPALCKGHGQLPGLRRGILRHPEGKGIVELQMGPDELQERRSRGIPHGFAGFPCQLLHRCRGQFVFPHLLCDGVAMAEQIFLGRRGLGRFFFRCRFQ